MKYLACKYRVLLALIFVTNFVSAQDIFDIPNTQVYANYLYELRQFKLAIPEFEKLIYFNPSDTTNQLKLYRSYRLEGQHELGLTSAKLLYRQTQLVPNMVLPELAKSLQRINLTDSAIYILKHHPTIEEGIRTGHIASVYSLVADWENANFWISKSNHPDFSNIQVLIQKSEGIKYKRKGLAALMSAVVPGSGKFYTKDWKDGLFSLIFVGTSTFQSVRGFNNKGIESVQGWFFGGMALGFYTGNIAGAYQSAYQYNKKLDQQIIEQIEKEYFR